jgi:hypothetical protein
MSVPIDRGLGADPQQHANYSMEQSKDKVKTKKKEAARILLHARPLSLSPPVPQFELVPFPPSLPPLSPAIPRSQNLLNSFSGFVFESESIQRNSIMLHDRYLGRSLYLCT